MSRVDAAVSSDGRILYIAWTPTDGGDDQLASYDALNGVQRWRVNVQCFQEDAEGVRTIIAHWGDEEINALEHGALFVFEGGGK